MIAINKNLTPKAIRLFLCKPNRETIAELKDAYQLKIKIAANGIDELNFRIPYKVMRNNTFVKYKHIDQLKGHYLIRYEEGNYKAYFLINKPVKFTDNGASFKDVSCYLQPYELNDKIIRSYQATKKLYDPITGEGIINDTLLKRTDWSIEYIDADISAKYRTFDISEKTMLDFLNELADAFDATILWDSVDKKISFYKSESLGQDKGLSIEYGKYLKTISEEPDFDNIVTRLFISGKNGISINKYNPAGTDYLESFAYYLHPFSQDENGNVLTHSTYMSDDLCQAILAYEQLLTTKEGQFSLLLDHKQNQEAKLLEKDAQLFTLETELQLIEDQLITANATDNPTEQLLEQKNNMQIEISEKSEEINGIKAEISSIDNQIAAIKSEVAVENNFTPQLIRERNRFIKEKVWVNEHYFSEKELYTEGHTQLAKIHQPIIQYKIDIVDFLKVVHCQKDWDKLNKFDIVTIHYPELAITIRAKIIEIERDYDNNAIQLTIANADDLRNGFIEYKELIAKFASSSTRVDMSKFKWDETEANVNRINNVINDTWDANVRRIKAGVNESVEISRKGITITSIDYPNEMLLANAGIIGISNDYGNSFKNAITTKGIVGERIFGKLLAGTNLMIDASDAQGQKTFTVDQSGVKIKGSALTIEGGINEENLASSFVTRIDNAITNVSTWVTHLETEIGSFLSDEYLTYSEASQIETTLVQLKSESTDLIATAVALGIVQEQTSYQSALTSLEAYLSNYIGKTSSSYPMPVLENVRNELKLKLQAVQSKKSILINKIMSIRESNTIHYIDSEINQVATALDTMENKINEYSDDLKITLTEAKSLELSLTELLKESEDLLAIASSLGIITEKANYQNALRLLEQELQQTWINQSSYPANVTETERELTKELFGAVQEAKSKLINKIGEIREQHANNYTDNQFASVSASVSSLSGKINEYSDDGKITLAEANSFKLTLEQLKKESVELLAVAQALNITTLRTNYLDSLTSFETEIKRWIDKDTYPLSISSTDRANLQNYIGNVQDAKSKLINTIGEIREQQAKSYTDVQFASVSASVSSLFGKINEYSDDGKITLAEANSFKLTLEQLKKESIELLAVAQVLNITTLRTDYINSLAVFETEINRWIDKGTYPLTISPTDRINLQHYIGNVQEAKSKLINKIGEIRTERLRDEAVLKGELLNGVKIDAASGLVVTRSDDKVKSIFNATNGIKVQVKEGTNFVDKLYFNPTTSKLVIDGEIHAQSMKINGSNVLTENNTKISGNFIDRITTDQLVAGTAKISKSLIVDLEDNLQNISTQFAIQNGLIENKISMTDFNGDIIVSKITQSPTAINVLNQNINLTGKVTFSSFDSTLQNTINGKANTSLLGSLAYNNVIETAQLGSSVIQGGLIRTELISTNISQVASRLHLGSLYNESSDITGIFFSDRSRIASRTGVDGIYISAPLIILESTTYLGTYEENNRLATKGDIANVIAKFG